MTVASPRVTLHDVQRPVVADLEQVVDELRRIIAADFPIVTEVNEHLLQMKGKLFRPTLLLLSSKAAGAHDARAVTLAAVVELIHLATLVHDDSVDHSVLRRGLPTINALFSHQIAVIMGDYLYSRAIIELVKLDDRRQCDGARIVRSRGLAAEQQQRRPEQLALHLQQMLVDFGDDGKIGGDDAPQLVDYQLQIGDNGALNVVQRDAGRGDRHLAFASAFTRCSASRNRMSTAKTRP